MSNVSQWNVSAANNNAAVPNGWPEGMARSGVNDSARENMAALARWYKDINGSLVTAGTGDAFTLTTNNAHAALADLSVIRFRADRSATGAATLNVDSLGAKTIRPGGRGLIVKNRLHTVVYNATEDVYELLDPTQPVGSVYPFIGSTSLVPTGWVLMQGTIGNAASGATTRANADTEELFELLWDSMADAQAPVSGGRGASAQADFDANKTIGVPDPRSRSLVATGQGSGLTNRVHGDTGGAETRTIARANLPNERLLTIAGGSSTSPLTAGTTVASTRAGGGDNDYDLSDLGAEPNLGRTDALGSGTAMDWMHPWLALNFIVKL